MLHIATGLLRSRTGSGPGPLEGDQSRLGRGEGGNEPVGGGEGEIPRQFRLYQQPTWKEPQATRKTAMEFQDTWNLLHCRRNRTQGLGEVSRASALRGAVQP